MGGNASPSGEPLPPTLTLPPKGGGDRSKRSRVKHAFTVGITTFVLFQLALNVALDTSRPEWRDPEYGHRLKLVRAVPRPLVVVLGSSRPQMGLSPSDLGIDGFTVFNHSQAGCGPVQEVLTLNRLLADGVTPDFVLVEVLSPVLTGNAPAEKLLKPLTLSYADLGRVEPYCDNPVSLREEWAKTRILPVYSHRLGLLNHIDPRAVPWEHRTDFMSRDMDRHGWLPYPFARISDEKRASGTAAARSQYAGYFADFRVADRPRQAYRDLLATCRARKIPVAFFVMPESDTFRGWYPPAARDGVAAYLAELRHDAPVFDARDWLPAETWYADGHHLMRPGAEAFSRRFGAECVGPWLKEAAR